MASWLRLELSEVRLTPNLRIPQCSEGVVVDRDVIPADKCSPFTCRLLPDKRLVLADGKRVLLLCGAALPCALLRHWVY